MTVSLGSLTIIGSRPIDEAYPCIGPRVHHAHTAVVGCRCDLELSRYCDRSALGGLLNALEARSLLHINTNRIGTYVIGWGSMDEPDHIHGIGEVFLVR